MRWETLLKICMPHLIAKNRFELKNVGCIHFTGSCQHPKPPMFRQPEPQTLPGTKTLRCSHPKSNQSCHLCHLVSRVLLSSIRNCKPLKAAKIHSAMVVFWKSLHFSCSKNVCRLSLCNVVVPSTQNLQHLNPTLMKHGKNTARHDKQPDGM